MGRLLALDVGEVVVGVAVTDDRQVLSTPLPPVVRKEGSMALGSFRRLIEKYQPEQIIVGIPKQDGKGLSLSARKIKAFAVKLIRHFPDQVFVFRDERLSTWSVKEKYERLELRKGDGPINLDSFAAMEILDDLLSEKDRGAPGA